MELISCIIAGVSALCAAIALIFNGFQTKRENKLSCLAFVCKQLDHLNDNNIRELLLQMDKDDIIQFIANDNKKEQQFKQYLYALNRICGAIQIGALDKKTVYKLWPKAWFEELYIKFKPLIEQEERKRGKIMYTSLKKTVGR